MAVFLIVWLRPISNLYSNGNFNVDYMSDGTVERSQDRNGSTGNTPVSSYPLYRGHKTPDELEIKCFNSNFLSLVFFQIINMYTQENRSSVVG